MKLGAVILETSGCERSLNLGQIKPRSCDRDTRPDVGALRDLRAEILGDQMAPRIERDNPLRSRPLREWPDHRGRMGVGEVGTADRAQRAR